MQIIFRGEYMKKYIVDRFEDIYAVCEDFETEEMIDILIEKLPEDVQEGDVIIEDEDVFYIDHEETEARREQMAQLLKQLMNKNKEGENDARVDEGTETSD